MSKYPDPREAANLIYDVLVELEDTISESQAEQIENGVEILVRIANDLAWELLNNV